MKNTHDDTRTDTQSHAMTCACNKTHAMTHTMTRTHNDTQTDNDTHIITHTHLIMCVSMHVFGHFVV